MGQMIGWRESIRAVKKAETFPADRQALGGGKRLGDENTRCSFAILSIFCDL